MYCEKRVLIYRELNCWVKTMSVHIGVSTREKAKNVFVFDFDLTILKIHATGARVRASEVTREKAQADCADLDFFQTLVPAIFKRGDTLCVASYGHRDVIRAYINLLCGEFASRVQILTPASVGGTDGMDDHPDRKGENKVKMLRKVGGEKRDVCFFDDTATNTRAAKAAGYSRSYTVPSGGLTLTWWMNNLPAEEPLSRPRLADHWNAQVVRRNTRSQSEELPKELVAHMWTNRAAFDVVWKTRAYSQVLRVSRGSPSGIDILSGVGSSGVSGHLLFIHHLQMPADSNSFLFFGNEKEKSRCLTMLAFESVDLEVL